MDNASTSTTSQCDTECAVCLQLPVHPVQIPCGHVFCYLCVKGLGDNYIKADGWILDGRCPLCRERIPSNYVTQPVLLHNAQTNVATDRDKNDDNKYAWYYMGRSGGWWMYDERTQVELENARCNGQAQLQTLIAGHVYIIDLQSEMQYRRDMPIRKRRIKRAPLTLDGDVKGVAGLTKQLINKDTQHSS